MRNIFGSLFIFCAVVFSVSDVHAVDLQPGEIRAPKPGLNIIQLSFFHLEKGDYYVSGRKQAGDPEIISRLLYVRFGHAFEVMKRPGVFYAQMPVGFVHTGGSLSPLKEDSGFGDITFALGFWPYVNRETKTYFAIAAYLFAPSGSYSNERVINLGENRYRMGLQAGFHAPLSGKFEWMGALDSVWYQANRDYGVNHDDLNQKALYSAQLGLLYNFTPRYSAAGTYFYSLGGETSVNGVDKNNETRVHRYILTGIANYSFGRITLQYGSDLKTENGFFEKDRLILRYTKAF